MQGTFHPVRAAKVCEEAYATNDGTTQLTLEATKTNESQTLDANVRNDEKIEPPRVERNDAHPPREPSDLDVKDKDIRQGLEETETPDNTVNEDDHDPREYAVEGIVHHTERDGRTH